MIESVVPIGATVREGDAEFGVTWLLVGDNWMVLDYASRGVDTFYIASVSDDTSRTYGSGGGGGSGGLDGILHSERRLLETLDPRATKLHITFAEPREDAHPVAEMTVPVSRVPATMLRARVGSATSPFRPAPGTCLECGERSREWQCSACRDEEIAIGGRGRAQLVPEIVGPVCGDLDLVDGLRHAMGGILAWENTFVLRFFFEPVPGSRGGPNDPPGPIVGRWTGEDASGRFYAGRTRQSGFGTGGGRAFGDATIEFMPALDPTSGPLVLRSGPPGHPVLELELPLEPRG